MKVCPELIGKQAAEHGVAATIRFYAKRLELKESSVRTWRNVYTRELQKKRREGGDVTVTELAEKKRGRPYLLGDELDSRSESI